MKIIKDFKIIAFDGSSGPYRGVLDVLKERIQQKELDRIIVPLEGDVRDMKAIDDECVDLIISNELFCDLDRKGLERTLGEFHRILKIGGQMAHGELVSLPENSAQRLLIKADSFSLETLTLKYEWFSPSSDEVAAILHKLGFKDISVKYFETDVHLSFNDAVKQLKEWNIEPVFIEKNVEGLKKYGLEFPLEHVVFCWK